MTTEQTDAAARKEALDFWGYMIKPDKCGTETLDRLLNGIASFISTRFQPSDSPDLTPSQLAAFYRAVGGDYDVLFVDTLPSSIAFIYRSLGCFHSLQPSPEDDGYSAPNIPALKKKGFVTWQTIQLLLGPEEHVPYLQNAVRNFDIIDSSTGRPFPKILPSECFPDKPDEAMEQWYEGVAERLKKEAQEEEKVEHTTRVRVEVDEPRGPSDTSVDGSADERHGAASYFADPLLRKSRKPTYLNVRRFSKPRSPIRSPMQFVEDRGRLIANSVRHMWNPSNKRQPMPGNYESTESESDNDATPMATAPRYSHKRPQRRDQSLSATESDSDSDGPARRRRSNLRHENHERPASPREYFPKFTDDPRRYTTRTPEIRTPVRTPVRTPARSPEPSSSSYGPTGAPLFATKVAHLQSQNYYDRRPTMPPRASYQPHRVRYSTKGGSPRESYDYGERTRRRSEEYLPRDRVERERISRSHDRDIGKDRDWEDSSRSRDRDRDRRGRDRDSGRDRDRDREKDRDRDRDREYERDREAERSRTHRYVAPVDGVGGRRYPVESWR